MSWWVINPHVDEYGGLRSVSVPSWVSWIFSQGYLQFRLCVPSCVLVGQKSPWLGLGFECKPFSILIGFLSLQDLDKCSLLVVLRRLKGPFPFIKLG